MSRFVLFRVQYFVHDVYEHSIAGHEVCLHHSCSACWFGFPGNVGYLKNGKNMPKETRERHTKKYEIVLL